MQWEFRSYIYGTTESMVLWKKWYLYEGAILKKGLENCKLIKKKLIFILFSFYFHVSLECLLYVLPIIEKIFDDGIL